jgi:predicted outer membrane repeat protein
MGNGNNLTLNLTGCVFEDNGSVDGGGLFFRGATATLTGCTFKNNGAKNCGGGLCGEDSLVTLNKCVFTLNSAKGKGGGIALSGVELTMGDCVVAQNGSKTAGGGLWFKATSSYDGSGNIDNCSFYLNEVAPVYKNSDPDLGAACFELSGRSEVNIRLSTFAYHQGEQVIYRDPHINFFGCILEGDGLEKELPSAQNGYCLIYDGNGGEPIIDSEQRLTDLPHLNCINDDPALRIPLEAVKEAYGDAFSGYYGVFPVGDNSGEVEMTFVFHSLRTQIVKASRGTPIPEIPAPMRDMYSFGGWYLPDGSRLAGYRLLVGGDVSSMEISPLWTHNTKYYLTLAGCGFAVACGVIGWVVIKKRMRAVQLPESADGV